MTVLPYVAGVGLIAALALPSVPSDPMGVYCLVDKVVLEPADKPDRAQVWGVCAVANENDWYFQAPKAGYFYYSAPAGREDVARAEWADLKSVAGTREVIGFGRRYHSVGRLRVASEKPTAPETYPLHIGVTKVGSRRLVPEVMEIAAKIRAVRGQ